MSHQTNTTDVNESRKTMEYSKMKYYLGFGGIDKSGKCIKDLNLSEKKGILIAEWSANKSEETNVIICIPEYSKDINSSDLDTGRKLLFSTHVTDGIDTWEYQELIIGMDDQFSYLLVEKTERKLWKLPAYVVNFLKMYKMTGIGMSIIDNKLSVIKMSTRNTFNNKVKIDWASEITVSPVTGGEFIDNNQQTSEAPIKQTKLFIYPENVSPEEKLTKSYFTKYKVKYYLDKCSLTTNSTGDMILVMGVGIGQPHDNVKVLLGFAPLSDEQQKSLDELKTK